MNLNIPVAKILLRNQGKQAPQLKRNCYISKRLVSRVNAQVSINSPPINKFPHASYTPQARSTYINLYNTIKPPYPVNSPPIALQLLFK